MDDPGMAARFSVWDYVVLAAMLSISALIGIFYACAGGKQKTAAEYLLADRNANPLPVAFSLVASFVSAITVLGVPAEVYAYGARYWLFGFAFFVAGLISSLLIPVFLGLRIISANEYLELRFGRVIRGVGTFITFITTIFYMSVVIYAPALALNQVTGVSLWGCVIATGVVCTFYTTIGGMKAVVWTDVFQTLVMLSGMLAIIGRGSINLGGFANVWQINDEGGRLNFWEFDPHPTVRHSFWSIMVGGGFTWGAIYGTNQAQIMRYLSCGTVTRARISLSLAVVGMVIVVSAAILTGLVMYATYSTCDPYLTGIVGSPDQLLPYLVVDLFGDTPGLAGLFTAAIFSAAMSTVSSGLNALTAVTTEDVITKCFPSVKKSDATYAIVSKVVLCTYGTIAIALTYVASLLGSVLQLTLSIGGMVGGPALGVFTLGMFFPWSNQYGALVGIVCGIGFTCYVGVGTWVDNFLYTRFPNILPLDFSGCPRPPVMNVSMTTMMTTTTMPMTSTMMMTPMTEAPAFSGPPEQPAIFKLSYLWYSFYGWLIAIVIGLIVSFLTGATDPRKLNPKLINPIANWLFCCLPSQWKTRLRCGVGELYEEEDDLVAKEACEVKSEMKGIDSGLVVEAEADDVDHGIYHQDNHVQMMLEGSVPPPSYEDSTGPHSNGGAPGADGVNTTLDTKL